MNKTININLGGYAFIIDEDAFDTAEHYLHTLARHFSSSEGAAEIMQDIEARMGELVHKNKGARAVVNKFDILEAISVLGTPEELKDIDFAEGAPKKKAQGASSFQFKTGKRLFRDPDDKIVGGVCSGLASYLGIKDPIWVRIAFALLAATGGTGVLVYFIIWAFVPEAKTVSDRLEMMGEPTNVNNIAKMVRDGLEDLGDKLNDTFNKKGKKHGKKASPPEGVSYGEKDFV